MVRKISIWGKKELKIFWIILTPAPRLSVLHVLLRVGRCSECPHMASCVPKSRGLGVDWGVFFSRLEVSIHYTAHWASTWVFWSPKKLKAYTFFIYPLRWPMFTHCMDPVCWHVLLLSYPIRSHCIKTHVMDHCALGLSPYQEKIKLNHKFWNPLSLRMQFWLF